MTLSTLIASETSDVINCIAIAYEKGSSGNIFLRKEKFRTVQVLLKKDRTLKKIRETVKLVMVMMITLSAYENNLEYKRRRETNYKD